MKQVLIFGFIITMLTSCSSQLKTINLYGYKQAISPGKPAGYDTDEAGNPIPAKSKVRINYFIYLTHPGSLNIQPIELWIKGEQFALRAEEASSPVEMNYGDGPFDTGKELLVPETNDRVWLLVPVAKKGESLLSKKELANTNDLVLVYKKNSSSHTHSLKTMKTLRTAVMQ